MREIYRDIKYKQGKILRELGLSWIKISKILDIPRTTVLENIDKKSKQKSLERWKKYSRTENRKLSNNKREKTEKRKNWNKIYNRKPNVRIGKSLRSRMSKAIKKGYKSLHSQELLGCSIEECRQHLEAQFQPGMTWENYGAWHIDHKRPCCSFDLTDIEQQKECFNYKNLQPLWAKDNLSKGSKWRNNERAHTV